jgi:hypothetical protein
MVMNAHFETYESNVMKEEIISRPLVESIELKIDKFIIITKSKSWCFSCFIKPSHSTSSYLIPFSYLLLKKLELNQSMKVI